MAKKKYILFEIPEELHKKLKISAAERNITMRRYILQALLARFKQEALFH